MDINSRLSSRLLALEMKLKHGQVNLELDPTEKAQWTRFLGHVVITPDDDDDDDDDAGGGGGGGGGDEQPYCMSPCQSH